MRFAIEMDDPTGEHWLATQISIAANFFAVGAPQRAALRFSTNALPEWKDWENCA